MELPLDVRRGIPASEPGRLSDLTRRTRVLRLGATLVLVAALVLAFFVARSRDVRHAPLVPSGTTGMLVLDLSASVFEGALDQTVEKLSQTDEQIGLVVFSDQAYELLPPGSPSQEHVPLSNVRLHAGGRRRTATGSAGRSSTAGREPGRRLR